MPRRDAPTPIARQWKRAGSCAWGCILLAWLLGAGPARGGRLREALLPPAGPAPVSWTYPSPDFPEAPGLGAPSDLADDLPAAPLEQLKLYSRQGEQWTLQVMPSGLLYRSYLAGAKEPRFASYWNSDKNLGSIWDTATGGRLGVLRYGTQDPVFPEGWQVDLEGGVQARLDPDAISTPLLAADFRVGIPLTWAKGRWQFKTGYYHISSHLGDEYLLMNPGARRLNYVRDAINLGVGYFWTERLRLYTEIAYAPSVNDGAQPWEVQFGADWAPDHDTGLRGAPFVAVNAHLRQDVDFGGNFVGQAGWAWRRFPRGSLFRVGFEYFNGKSDQFEFFDRSEQRVGCGLWADF